jgi:lipopolysaccharide/colanic/teichoic acid biosynthesis glycosyltransferase
MDHPDGVDQAARQHGIYVLISANMSHVLSFWLVLQQVGPVIGLSLRPVRLTGKQEVAKRAFALVVGSILLLVTLPIWLAAELAIRLASRSPCSSSRSP